MSGLTYEEQRFERRDNLSMMVDSPTSAHGSRWPLNGIPSKPSRLHELGGHWPTVTVPEHAFSRRPALTFEIEEPKPPTRTDRRRLSTTLAHAFGLPHTQARHQLSFQDFDLALEPRLLESAAVHYAYLANHQQSTSRILFFLCAVFPPVWLVYGFGGLDWYMRYESNGEIESLDGVYKGYAVVLGCVYGMVTLAVFSLVIIYLNGM
ncbi:hypothetical protein MMC13_008249 [Lambiella insularis]|nr:hypothetical protein [Lambiella insularis]